MTYVWCALYAMQNMQLREKEIIRGDGIVDSVKYLTADFTKENKILLKMILYLQICNNDAVLSMFCRVLSIQQLSKNYINILPRSLIYNPKSTYTETAILDVDNFCE